MVHGRPSGRDRAVCAFRLPCDGGASVRACKDGYHPPGQLLDAPRQAAPSHVRRLRRHHGRGVHRREPPAAHEDAPGRGARAPDGAQLDKDLRPRVVLRGGRCAVAADALLVARAGVPVLPGVAAHPHAADAGDSPRRRAALARPPRRGRRARGADACLRRADGGAVRARRRPVARVLRHGHPCPEPASGLHPGVRVAVWREEPGHGGRRRALAAPGARARGPRLRGGARRDDGDDRGVHVLLVLRGHPAVLGHRGRGGGGARACGHGGLARDVVAPAGVGGLPLVCDLRVALPRGRADAAAKLHHGARAVAGRARAGRDNRGGGAELPPGGGAPAQGVAPVVPRGARAAHPACRLRARGFGQGRVRRREAGPRCRGAGRNASRAKGSSARARVRGGRVGPRVRTALSPRWAGSPTLTA
jgi:hypothetical protein